MLVIGGGATGVQVASIFSAFGTRVELFEAASRILPTEDEDVSAAVAVVLSQGGDRGARGLWLDRVLRERRRAASRWPSRRTAYETAPRPRWWSWRWAGRPTRPLSVSRPRASRPTRGDSCGSTRHLRTSAPHIFAAGDVTGRLMLVPQALQDGFVAATNAVRGPRWLTEDTVSSHRQLHRPRVCARGPDRGRGAGTHDDVVVAVVRFDSTTRPIIDGRTTGFCKLIVDRATTHDSRLPRRGRACGRHRAARPRSPSPRNARRSSSPGSRFRSRPTPGRFRRPPRR